MHAPISLEIKDLAVHIGGLVILERMSLSVPKGKIVSLIGPNGAGKTTAFNIITGYMKPSAGTVLFEGRNLLDMTSDEIAALGLVRTFQRTSIFAGCTVAENILTAMHLRGRAGLFGAIFRTPSVLREEVRLQAEVDDILRLCRVAADAHRRMPAASPMASSGCSGLRLRLPHGRSCCCSTSRLPASTRPKPSASRNWSAVFATMA